LGKKNKTYLQNNRSKSAGGRAQAVKCLLHKLEVLSSSPSYSVTNLKEKKENFPSQE
jgi:hypothetical protein